MNKSELVESIANKVGLTTKESQTVLKAFLETVREELTNGGEVVLIGFGKFHVRDRAARTARNPRDGKPIKIEASKLPSFSAGRALKDAVNHK